MITVKTLIEFFDLQQKTLRETESIFEAEDERAIELISLGFVEKESSKKEAEVVETDLELTKAECPEKVTEKTTRKPKKQTPED